MNLQLLMAELRREPWPIDLFDPTRQPLRKLLRDGKVIGAYSIGENQVDDGGDQKKDLSFLLFGPLEPVTIAVPEE